MFWCLSASAWRWLPTLQCVVAQQHLGVLRWQDNHSVTLNLQVKFKYSELHVALAIARLHPLSELAA
jgi:hypothetical protein